MKTRSWEESRVEMWEYKSLLCDGQTMEATLTALGGQGWEAVGFAPVVHNWSSSENFGMGTTGVTQWSASQYRVLLKRRKA